MNRRRVPIWFLVLIIVSVLPVTAYPTLMSMWPQGGGNEMGAVLWLYPAYVIASGVFAYICWPTRRTEAWILLAMLLLSHAAMWTLALNN